MNKAEINQQVVDYLKKIGVHVTIERDCYTAPPRGIHGKKQRVNKYNVTIERDGKIMEYDFYHSVAASHKVIPANDIYPRREIQTWKNAPQEYEVLSCLTWEKSWISFSDFCAQLGCSDDSISALKSFLSVEEDYCEVCHMFSREERARLSELVRL